MSELFFLDLALKWLIIMLKKSKIFLNYSDKILIFIIENYLYINIFTSPLMEINRYFYYKKKEKKFCGCLILGNGIFVIARFFPSFSYVASFYWSNICSSLASFKYDTNLFPLVCWIMPSSSSSVLEYKEKVHNFINSISIHPIRLTKEKAQNY